MMSNSSRGKNLEAVGFSLGNGFYFKDDDSSFKIVRTGNGYVHEFKSFKPRYKRVNHLPEVQNDAEAYGRFIAEVYDHLCKEVGMEQAAYFVAEYCSSSDLFKN